MVKNERQAGEIKFDIMDMESCFPREAVESGARVLRLTTDACVETSDYMASLREFFAVLKMDGLTSICF